MKILKNIYKWFIGIFTEPVLDYEAANSIAKFGIILDDKSKLKNAIQHINSLIRFKSESRDKSLILEITDYQKVIDDLGFTHRHQRDPLVVLISQSWHCVRSEYRQRNTK